MENNPKSSNSHYGWINDDKFAMTELEKYFDEDKWIAFTSAFKSKREENNPHWTSLSDIFENEPGIVSVIFEMFGNKSLKWIKQQVPALDNLTPKECSASDKLKKSPQGLLDADAMVTT